MRCAFRVFVGCAFLALLGVGYASAQTIDFNLLLTPQTGSPGTIPNNQQINIVGQVGTQSQVSITATYTGSTHATIAAPPPPVPQVLGSTEFTAKIVSTTTGSTALPIELGPGQSFTFTVTFTPTDATQASAQVSIPFTEPGTTGTPIQSAIILQFIGGSPQFTLSYIFPPPGADNVIMIPSGGTIPFTNTLLNTTTTAVLNITDEGSAVGVITNVALTGSPDFKLTGTPLFPVSLTGSNPTLSIGVVYSPTTVQNDTGVVTITYQGGSTATVNLTGSGTTSTFTYKYLVSGTSTAVTPGGTITFPGANIGSTSSLIVQVTNTGSATGTISSVSTQGSQFTLTNPVTLPATLTTGNSFSVPLTFTPTQVGAQTGGVLIGNDFFTLSGQGLGSNLTYAYTSNGSTTTVNPVGGAVLFNSIAVGKSEQVAFTVTNSGSLPATISLVGTTPSNGPFTVSAVSAKTLAPNQSLPFTITFTPTTTGITDGTLVVNTTSIQLVGNASAPPALPSYTITGPTGTVPPASQDNVSLTLASGYPVDLNGVLTLTTSGNFGTDPAVQFASGSSTGNRTVDFTIPANSTSANFVGQGSQILLQTGTVAETVTLTPSFATPAGLDVTPSSPATLQFSIPSSAPVLESVQLSNETASSFSLIVVGYSTVRSLTSLNVTFNPAPGFNLTTTQFTVDVSQVAGLWFQSTGSQAFGGLFEITLPFNLTGTVSTGHTLLQTIAAVSATVSNSVGGSNSLSVNVE
ncbi:MAG TPA: choice-of-anchor D domain-containing protein [Bryobacteraceae bacterium]|nr:choice-of-anchor D domain-containing protein [Bryobacteraceae bacterium]